MILQESEGRWGPKQAERYTSALEAACQRIGAYPEIGSVQAGLPSIRAFPSGQHRIFYQTKRDRILILRILHQRINLSDDESS